MEDSKGNLVPRSEEGSPATGTVLEMIQERVSSGARYNEDVIFLRTEADSEASLVPPTRTDPLYRTPLREGGLHLPPGDAYF